MPGTAGKDQECKVSNTNLCYFVLVLVIDDIGHDL